MCCQIVNCTGFICKISIDSICIIVNRRLQSIVIRLHNCEVKRSAVSVEKWTIISISDFFAMFYIDLLFSPKIK